MQKLQRKCVLVYGKDSVTQKIRDSFVKFIVEDVNISENNYNVYRQCQNFKAKETDSEMVCNTPLNILEEKNIYVVSPMFLTSDRLGLSPIMPKVNINF